MSGVVLLKHARNKLGLKKSQLSRLLGVHESFLSRVESGKRAITEDLEGFASIVTKLLAPPLSGDPGATVTSEEIIAALGDIPVDRKKGYIINMTLAGLGMSKGRKEIVGMATGIEMSDGVVPAGEAPNMLALKHHIDDLKAQISSWSHSSDPSVQNQYLELARIFAQGSEVAAFIAHKEQLARKKEQEDGNE